MHMKILMVISEKFVKLTLTTHVDTFDVFVSFDIVAIWYLALGKYGQTHMGSEGCERI